MIYTRKSKYNEQNLLELVRDYLKGCADIVIPIHRRPGYRLQHHYNLGKRGETMKPTICRVTFVETEKWGSLPFHIFSVEITSNGRTWTAL